VATIIGFSQWKDRASQQFEAPGRWRRQQLYSRDERFKNQAHHKAKPDKAHPKKPAKCYRPAGFTYGVVAWTFICPAGKLL
jgi:hypothetical protein